MKDDDFLSINKLVEFGLGMGIAQQMVRTMNEAMANMKTPGTFSNYSPLQVSNYYVLIDNDQLGPLSEQEVMKLILDGKLKKEDFVWQPGMPNWDLAKKVSEINKLFSLQPPPIPKQE
jgi:hypothetical protein